MQVSSLELERVNEMTVLKRHGLNTKAQSPKIKVSKRNKPTCTLVPASKFPSCVVMDDKYELALQVKNKSKERLNNARTDPTYQKWNSQNEDIFGFIPLGPLILPNCDKKLEKGLDPIKLYDITRSQETFIFLSIQIRVHSQLNPEVLAIRFLGPTTAPLDQIWFPVRF